MQTLFAVLVAVGVVFGAVEVGVTVAANALGGTAVAGPLLAVWGIGSLTGGLVASRLGGGARSGRGLALILTALAGGHLALGLLLGHAVALACGLFVAGATIAPTYATVYDMVGEVAPGDSVTEAFAWLSTAVAVGAAGGSGRRRNARRRGRRRCGLRRWPAPPGPLPSCSCSHGRGPCPARTEFGRESRFERVQH